MDSREHAGAPEAGSASGAGSEAAPAAHRALSWLALAILALPFIEFALLLCTGKSLHDFLPPHTLTAVALVAAGAIAARPKAFWDTFGWVVSLALVWLLFVFSIHWLAGLVGFHPLPEGP